MIQTLSGAFRAAALTALCLASGGVLRPAEAAPGGYVITGVANGAADGTVVQLTPTTGEQIDVMARKEPIATTTTKDGRFTLAGSVDYPAPYSVVFVVSPPSTDPRRAPYQPEVTLFLENSPIDVVVTMADLPKDLPAAFAGKPGHLRAQVKGSASHDLYLTYKAATQPLEDARSTQFQAYSRFLGNRRNRPVSDGIAIVTRMDEAVATRTAYVMKFISEHRDDFVGLHVAKMHLGNLKLPEFDPMLNGFSSRIRSSAAWAPVQTEADRIRQSAVGATFVDLAFNDPEGKPVKLSDHVGKGRYVLLEFWASWCGPCRADIPHLKEAHQLYNPAGFEIVSISMDGDKDAWLKAVADEKMPWIQASDLKAFAGEVSKIYNFRGIPACVLVGPDGKIVDRNMRGSWMDRKLIELYGDKFGAAAAANEAKK